MSKSTPHRTIFVNMQGEHFNTLQDLEAYEMEKVIFKELHMFIIENFQSRYTKDFFQFLVKHRQEVVLLLTNGHLETKYETKRQIK